MSLKRSHTLYAGVGIIAALAVTAVLPASVGTAAEIIPAPALAYDLETMAAPSSPTVQSPAQQASMPATPVANANSPVVVPATAPAADTVAVDEAARICIAKVVLHEAGNQPRSGKIAVAQTLVNRVEDGHFGDDVCEVANQPGQYFNLSNYRPSRDSDAWADAMDIAEDVLRGETDEVAPGALFFRANYAPANTFFRKRTRVTQVGAHIFYR
jgi:N-acetylmuramoyl-L-alanine amidase